MNVASDTLEVSWNGRYRELTATEYTKYAKTFELFTESSKLSRIAVRILNLHPLFPRTILDFVKVISNGLNI